MDMVFVSTIRKLPGIKRDYRSLASYYTKVVYPKEHAIHTENIILGKRIVPGIFLDKTITISHPQIQLDFCSIPGCMTTPCIGGKLCKDFPADGNVIAPLSVCIGHLTHSINGFWAGSSIVIYKPSATEKDQRIEYARFYVKPSEITSCFNNHIDGIHEKATLLINDPNVLSKIHASVRQMHAETKEKDNITSDNTTT
jgi:hypothetical protein